MPTVFRENGYRFFFYSNEGIPIEPCHIHVRQGSSVAKFWIEPMVSLDHSYGFSPAKLRKLAKTIIDNKELI